MKASELKLGDVIEQKSRGRGVVIGKTARTLTFRFRASSVRYSFNVKHKLIELDGSVLINT